MGQNTATRIGRKGEDTMTSLNFRTINKTGPRVSRSMKILDSMVGQVIQVHNGRSWRSVRINSERVGFRAGEFVATTAWYKQEVSRTRGVGGMAARGNKAPAAPRKAKRL